MSFFDVNKFLPFFLYNMNLFILNRFKVMLLFVFVGYNLTLILLLLYRTCSKMAPPALKIYSIREINHGFLTLAMHFGTRPQINLGWKSWTMWEINRSLSNIRTIIDHDWLICYSLRLTTPVVNSALSYQAETNLSIAEAIKTETCLHMQHIHRAIEVTRNPPRLISPTNAHDRETLTHTLAFSLLL